MGVYFSNKHVNKICFTIGAGIAEKVQVTIDYTKKCTPCRDAVDLMITNFPARWR